MKRYAIVIGAFDGYLQVTQYIQSFGGNIVMDPTSIETETVETLFGDSEVLIVQADIPEKNVPYFDKLSAAFGMGEVLKAL